MGDRWIVTTPAPESTACEECEAELAHRRVRLALETGTRHVFCSDHCERKWLVTHYERMRAALTRIYIRTSPNSPAAKLARDALYAAPADEANT